MQKKAKLKHRHVRVEAVEFSFRLIQHQASQAHGELEV